VEVVGAVRLDMGRVEIFGQPLEPLGGTFDLFVCAWRHLLAVP